MDIKALGYIAIESTNIESWRHFATDVVGMMIAPGMPEDEDLYLKMDEHPWRIRIFKGEQDRLAIAGWEVEDEASFNQAIKELEANDVACEFGSKAECDARRVKNFVRFRDPAGGQLELFYQMKLDYARLISPVGVSNFITGYHGDMGLGHYVIPTNNFAATVDFYVHVMGFGKTDYMHFHFSDQQNDPGQGLHFLHVNNPRHHSLAIFDDPNPPAHGCVHLMFEVPSVDEVGYFIDRCKQNDVQVVSSLGRHTNDLMMSVYVESPAGFALEYGCDGVQLDWKNYKVTESAEPSLWGHNWGG